MTTITKNSTRYEQFLKFDAAKRALAAAEQEERGKKAARRSSLAVSPFALTPLPQEVSQLRRQQQQQQQEQQQLLQ
jgi:hypothetical protein